MRQATIKSLFFALFILFGCRSFGQSGPGGHGQTDGMSNLVLWLRADTGVEEAAADPAEDTDPVSTWLDQSGYGYDAVVGGGTPFWDAAHTNFNSMPVITFVEGNTDWLTIEDDADEAPQLDNTNELSVFYVYNPDNSTSVRAHISKRDGNGSAQSYVFYENNAQNSRTNGNNDAGQNITGSTTYINALTYQNGDFDHFLNQVSGGGVSGGTTSIPNNNSDLNIGEFQSGDGRTFDGDMAEIIIFREFLTNAERIVVETYLGSKYGITLTSDFWDETTYATYDNEIAGIGQHSDGSIANNATSAVLSISGGDDRTNGEWLFWGHDNGDFATYTATEVVTGTSQMRLAREWVVNETNDLGNVTVSIASTDIPLTGLVSPSFYLLVDTDGDASFEDAASNLMTLNGGNYEVAVDLAEGDHLALAFVPPVPANVNGTLAFWFAASIGVENSGMAATNGQNVTVWQDLSSNDEDGQNGTSPTYFDANTINFRPIVQFDAASSEYLEFDITGLEGADYTTMTVVRRTSSSANQYILGSQNNAADALLLGYSSNTQLDTRNSSTASTNTTVSAFDSSIEGPALIAVDYNSTNLNLDEFREGTNNSSTSVTSIDYAATGYTGNLGRALAGNYLDGDVAEIVSFSSNLSSGDFNALASQLAIKYGIDLGRDYVDEQANLLWDISANTGFENDVIGIAYDASFDLDQRVSKAASDSIVLATSADFTSLNSTGSRTQLSDGQFFFIANDDDPYNLDQTYNATANSRLDRTWRVREVGSPGSVVIGLPTAAVGVNIMLVSSDPTFASGITEVSLATSGNYVYATHDFSDGDYFTFVNDASEIWYSYLSGNWNDPLNWTLDGAISALYVNPDSKIPNAGDSVVIKTGRTITMNVNNISVTKMEIIGTLDLAATTGHNFSYFEGAGTLRLAGAAGVENYPAGEDSLFYDADEGGTLEINGTGISLDNTRRTNNLVVNMTNATDVVTMTGDSIYVFGDMRLTNGFFQFNDNSATNSLAVEVRGDLLVEANGGIDVGTANARHEFNLYGDFTNQGDVDFTNRSSQTTGSEATNGIVDVNFVSSTQDQTVDLQNTTDFYRIEVNKGVDATYGVFISADNASDFNLYGRANVTHGSVAQLDPTSDQNLNAVGLYFGKLSLGTNVDVGVLNTGGNYNISEGATLTIDGGSASKTGGTAIVPYGNIEVNAGTLTADVGSGITTRGNGTLLVTGGTVSMRQFRTSVNGITNQGGIIQSGGIVNITGGAGTSGNYYLMNLTYTGNVYNISGGTLNINGANGKGAVFINSDDENITVTGGTTNIISDDTDAFNITSRAPFFNLNLSKTSGTGGDFVVTTGSSGPGGNNETIENLPLVVLNDLTIDNSGGNTTTFDANGNDVEITGSLIVESGASVDFSSMTLRFNGSGSSSLDIQLATTLMLDSLEINKNNGFVNVDISNGQATAIQVDDYLNVLNGNFDLSTFNVTANGAINVADTIGTATSTGQIYMNGGGVQTITSTAGAIYDLEIDNTNGVSLTGGIGILNILDLNAGIFDISTSNLTLNSEVQTTGTFSSTLMIETSGNSSDGGISSFFDADEVIVYPFGTAGKYTPVTANVSLTSSDDGYIQIIPVDNVLATAVSVTDLLDFYWRVGYSDFGSLPTVNSYVFTYDQTDVAGTESNYLPGFVEDNEDGDSDGDFFSRATDGTTADVDHVTNNTITFDGSSGFTLQSANYTAGESAAFAGSVTVYYSRKPQSGAVLTSWGNSDYWSTDAVAQHGGPADGGIPGAGDVIVMGHGSISNADNFTTCDPCTLVGTARHDIRIAANRTVAQVIFNNSPTANALNNADTRIRVSTGVTLTAERITGRGTIIQQATSASIGTITADIGEFNQDEDNGWFLLTQGGAGTTITITDQFDFPTLRIFGDRIVTYTSDVTAQGLVVDNNADLYVDNNFTISGTARIGLNQGGNIVFRNVGASRTFECDSLVLSTAAVTTNTVSVEDAGSDIHTLKVNGGINLLQAGSFDLYNAATTNVILELSGEGYHAFDNSAGIIPDLYRMVVNKGTDTTSIFSVDSDINILAANTTSPQSIELQNGKLILNNGSLNLELADNSDFSIPASAGLELTSGTVTSTGANIILDGLLRINGGTATLSSSDIEYSNSGSALMEITSGTLNVGRQIRRATTSSTGILKYRQTGGDVDIATDGAPTTSRAAFEVLNSGSEFTLTGGTFNIERGVTGDFNESLELNPTTFDVTGSTITIFENLGADYGASFFNVKSNLALNNLTISNSIDLPDVRLYTQPLTVGNLVINSNQTVIANGFDVTINGDFTNNGNYTNTSTSTILGSSGAQAVSGAGTFTIFDLNKIGAGTTTVSVNLDLDHDLRLTAGILDIASNSLSLQNDAYLESTLTNSGGNGLIFNGVSSQDMYGLTNTQVNIGTVTIQNASGVDIPDGNGYDFNITENLRLAGGVFNIGGSLVTVDRGAVITEVSTFGVNNMVQTNSSFTDNGLKQEFYGVAADTTVFFPVGELKYTPVQYDLQMGTTQGSIRIRPANERHPTIVDNAEPMAETEIVDTDNVLQYHWIVVAEDLTNANGTATFSYNQNDIEVTAPYDTSNYISARLLANDVNWDKFAPTLFLGASQTFEVPLATATSAEITGDYTSGVGSSDGINNNIEGAIPDAIAQYESVISGSGNYSTAVNWNPIGGSPAVTDGVGPVGAQIIVRNGDVVTLDISNIRLYATEIESGGTLIVPTGVTGIRLGTVTGSGTIQLQDNELLPTGEYSAFLACDGGALQYSGSTSYSVLSGISQIRKVTFDGTGTRTMPNNALTVCDSLIINGPTVNFDAGQTYAIGDADTDRLEIQSGSLSVTNGSTVNIFGDFIMSGGAFTGETNTVMEITDDVDFSAGTLDWNGTDVTLDGTTEQLIDGTFTGSASFDDLLINNSSITGVSINSGDIEVTGTLTLTDGLVNTTSSETLTLTSSGDWTGATTASYITGPMTKENIAVASTYEFPVGKTARYAPVSIVNVGTGGDDWTAEYFTSTNPTYDNGTFDNTDPGSGFNALNGVESSDRWEINSVTSNTALVRATYGTHNAFPGTNIRLVWWDDEAVLDGDGADNRWENQGGQVVGSASSGTVTSEAAIFFSTRQFGVGYAPESVLPVELLYFQGEERENSIILEWATATELNNNYFEIQHSLDGQTFESIATLDGNGTTSVQTSYSYLHKSPVSGFNYYRLRQVDFDGAEEYHSVIQVRNNFFRARMDVAFYPNPANSENMNLKVTSSDNHTPVTVRIIDLSGQVYFEKTFEASPHIDERLNVTKKMARGIYFMEVRQGADDKKRKIIIK